MTEYFVDGLLHCEDGPAVIIDPFIKKWYKHGMRHREDGPAIECGSYKEWWLFGSRHRLDGAAVERDMNVYKNPNYEQEWWLFGKEYREKEMFIQDLKKLKESILNKLIDAGVCKDLSTVIISYYTQN